MMNVIAKARQRKWTGKIYQRSRWLDEQHWRIGHRVSQFHRVGSVVSSHTNDLSDRQIYVSSICINMAIGQPLLLEFQSN